ncbi:hypothetical protein M0811_04908 [Anaeramoeba ignava]|uniref:Uncharacterized protein n=1 Tax=Anaeramoeba ignava TaxID=1746090 RepID=A0A9Q0RGB7_ANAIG|nr:hypothetical protein M0811_04908 [Anaeramoeba ignava]
MRKKREKEEKEKILQEKEKKLEEFDNQIEQLTTKKEELLKLIKTQEETNEKLKSKMGSLSIQIKANESHNKVILQVQSLSEKNREILSQEKIKLFGKEHSLTTQQEELMKKQKELASEKSLFFQQKKEFNILKEKISSLSSLVKSLTEMNQK